MKALEREKILVLKNTISELKISLDNIISRLDTTEDKISELESIIIKFPPKGKTENNC